MLKMENKKLNWYTAGGVEKHHDGSLNSFWIYRK